MTALNAPAIEQRLTAMAALIHQAIPGSEVRLFGSRARGEDGPDSDIDLLITAPDTWLESHHRFEVLNALWDQLAQADVSLDLLLYSQSECEARCHWRSHVIGRAYREGKLLHGPL
jgi:predicted nucleotidyltransferase